MTKQTEATENRSSSLLIWSSIIASILFGVGASVTLILTLPALAVAFPWIAGILALLGGITAFLGVSFLALLGPDPSVAALGSFIIAGETFLATLFITPPIGHVIASGLVFAAAAALLLSPLGILTGMLIEKLFSEKSSSEPSNNNSSEDSAQPFLSNSAEIQRQPAPPIAELRGEITPPQATDTKPAKVKERAKLSTQTHSSARFSNANLMREIGFLGENNKEQTPAAVNPHFRLTRK